MKLSAWLDRRDESGKKLITRAEFARRIGMSPASVTVYCAGDVWPTREALHAIVRETGGAVTANDFLHEPLPAAE